VIAQQDYDNAVQANLAAKAQVKAADAGVKTAKAGTVAAQSAVNAARAAVATAQVNLGFAKITSPIDGIAGISQAQIGDLINSNVPNSAPLTTVSAVDPIKVYFTFSEQEYLSFTRHTPSQSEWEAANKKLELELVLSDGTIYPQKGKFFVATREIFFAPDSTAGSARSPAAKWVLCSSRNAQSPNCRAAIRLPSWTARTGLIFDQSSWASASAQCG
jgi:membrane fusion protein (multidrug efflux system)